MKIKNYQEAEVNVIGYKKKDGAVLVGTGDMVQGHALGMSSAVWAVLWEILNQYGVEKGGTIWLPTSIKGQVKLTTLTPLWNMRDCSWIGFYT